MYQTLDSEIRECYLHAAGAIAVAIGLQGKIFRNRETLAPPSPHYKFAEQLPNFSKPVRKQGPFPVGIICAGAKDSRLADTEYELWRVSRS